MMALPLSIFRVTRSKKPNWHDAKNLEKTMLEYTN